MDKLFSPKEAAKFIGVTVRTLKRWRKSGHLVPDVIVTHGDRHDKFYSGVQLNDFFHKTMTTNSNALREDTMTNERINNDAEFSADAAQINPSQIDTPHPTTEERIAEAESFFNLLFGRITAPHFSYLITFPPKCYPFRINDETQRAAMARKAIELSDAGKGCWHAVNPVRVEPHYEEKLDPKSGKKKPFLKRGDREVVSYQTACVVDIDILGEAHKEKNLVLDFDEAKSLLPFPPSILINSGYGLQAYYLFDTPIEITDDNREECERRNRSLLEVIRQRANGKKADGVADLARILRTPGTFNYKLGKDNAPLCRVVEVNDCRFTPADLDEKLNAMQNQPKKQSPTVNSSKPARQENLYEDDEYDRYRACRMLDRINVADLDYDEWLHIGMALKNNGNSCADWDNFSRPDERYTEGECQSKWSGFSGDGLTIATIHEIAKRYGYDEKETRREWLALHPEFKFDKPSLPKQNPRVASALKLTEEQCAELYKGGITDRENSDRIAFLYGDRIKFVTNRDEWLVFEAGVWKVSAEKNSAIYPFTRKLRKQLETNARENRQFKYAKPFDTVAKTDAAIKFLRGHSKIRITSRDLDRHKNLINVQNGVVDLQTGKLMDAAPELLITRQANVIYRPDYTNEIVTNFFRDILPDEEDRAALVRWLGYALTGETSEQCALFTSGGGSNGKSTLFEFVMNMMGDYSANLPVKAIVEGREADANAATTHLNVLEGVRFALVDEFKPYHRLDEQRFKAITGDKKLAIRKLQHEFEQMEIYAKLFLNGNELPHINDTRSVAMLRRIRALTFKQQFSIERGNLDKDLPKKLATPEALSALLTICVQAAMSWYADGLIETPSMVDAKSTYLNENDFVEEFIAENCDFGNGGFIKLEDLKRRLKEEYPVETSTARIRDKTLRELIKGKMAAHGATYMRKTEGRGFEGVKWLENEMAFGVRPASPLDPCPF